MKKWYLTINVILVIIILNQICLVDCYSQKISSFDKRFPLPSDSKSNYVSEEKELRFLPVKFQHYFHYDIEAVFSKAIVEPFVIDEILVNDSLIREYKVCNNGQYNLLNRANGVEDLSIRFYSNWKSNEKYVIKVRGTSPEGKEIELKILSSSPEKLESGTLEFRGFVPFRRPIPAFPFFHVRATFFPKQYKPFSIDTVKVNGRRIEDYRTLNSIYYNYSFGLVGDGYGSPQQIRNIEIYDGKINSNNGFSLDIPCKWEKGDNINVIIKGKTISGEIQELTASAKNAPWSSNGIPGWSKYISLLISETAGISRNNEPVEVNLTFSKNNLNNPENELRVITYIQHGGRDEGEFVEIPVQILNVVSIEQTVSVKFVFPVDIYSFEDRVYLVCYGNPYTEKPDYKSGIKFIKNSNRDILVNTKRFEVNLDAKGNSIRNIKLFSQGNDDKFIANESSKYIHKFFEVSSIFNNSKSTDALEDQNVAIKEGPIEFKTSILTTNKNSSSVLEYRFYSEQPYILSESMTEINDNLKISSIQNNELLFNTDTFNEFLWKDESGDIQTLDISKISKKNNFSFDIPANTKWIAFINNKNGYGFAEIFLEANYLRIDKNLHFITMPYLNIKVKNSQISLTHGWGSTINLNLPILKGSIFQNISAIIPFEMNNNDRTLFEVEKTSKLLNNPLSVSIYYPQE